MTLVDRDPDRLVGTVLGGRFVVKRCAAVDHAGARYEAWDDEAASAASVRVLHGVRPDDGSLRKLVELLTEVSGLGLDGVPPLRAVGRTRKLDVYCATDEVSGEPLAAHVERGPMEPRDAIKIIAAVGDVLSRCHARGVVHGGLHPGAVIVPEPEGPGRVSVLDFGLAPLTAGGGALAGGRASASMPFQAPEQASDDPYDQRADIYALGALLYAALVGRPPFAGSSVLEVLAHQLRGEAPSLAKANPELAGTPLQGVVDRAMAVKPDDRLSTVEELVRAMRVAGKAEAARRAVAKPAAAQASSTPARKAVPAKGPQKRAPARTPVAAGRRPPPKRRRGFPWAPVGIAAVVLGAVAVYFAWSGAARRDEPADEGSAAVAPPAPEPAQHDEAVPEEASRDDRWRGSDGRAPSEPVAPLDPRALEMIAEGQQALQQGRFSLAVARFQGAKRVAPDSAIVARSLGLAHAELGESARAVAELQRYLELEPHATDARAIRLRIGQLQQER